MLEKAFFVSMYSTVNQYGDHGMEKQYSVFSTKFVACINSYEEVFLLMYVATYVRIIHVYMYMLVDMFLNQAHAWFKNICMLVCVCPPPRLLITSGVMWCDIDPI